MQIPGAGPALHSRSGLGEQSSVIIVTHYYHDPGNGRGMFALWGEDSAVPPTSSRERGMTFHPPLEMIAPPCQVSGGGALASPANES